MNSPDWTGRGKAEVEAQGGGSNGTKKDGCGDGETRRDGNGRKGDMTMENDRTRRRGDQDARQHRKRSAQPHAGASSKNVGQYNVQEKKEPDDDLYAIVLHDNASGENSCCRPESQQAPTVQTVAEKQREEKTRWGVFSGYGDHVMVRAARKRAWNIGIV